MHRRSRRLWRWGLPGGKCSGRLGGWDLPGRWHRRSAWGGPYRREDEVWTIGVFLFRDGNMRFREDGGLIIR